MQFSKLFDDDRAVSPVIGVILMVAITVILAAVIGTFVLGLGDQVQNNTPRASFGFETSNSTAKITITHESGDSIAASDIDVTSTKSFNSSGNYTGNSASSETWETASGSSDDVSAGSSVSIVTTDGGDFEGETVRVVYDNPDNDKTATLAKKEF